MDVFVENILGHIADSNPTTWLFILVILVSIVFLRKTKR
jgi:hypothetical protein